MKRPSVRTTGSKPYPFVVVEVCQTDERLPGAVQAQLPDVDVPRSVLAAELFHLPVALVTRVTSSGKDAFGFVISSRCLGEIPHLEVLRSIPMTPAKPCGW